jgi:hypothetical protein
LSGDYRRSRVMKNSPYRWHTLFPNFLQNSIVVMDIVLYNSIMHNIQRIKPVHEKWWIGCIQMDDWLTFQWGK